jgi:hypothetical protein
MNMAQWGLSTPWAQWYCADPFLDRLGASAQSWEFAASCRLATVGKSETPLSGPGLGLRREHKHFLRTNERWPADQVAQVRPGLAPHGGSGLSP